MFYFRFTVVNQNKEEFDAREIRASLRQSLPGIWAKEGNLNLSRKELILVRIKKIRSSC